MKKQKNLNLFIIFSISLMSVMGVSSITPAFPKIIDALKISQSSIGLLITVFTFPGVILTPVLGIMADRYGRKKIIVPSLFLFSVSGFLCFFARDLYFLLSLRFIQGIGAAALGALNLTIIGDIYSDNEKARIMGYNSSVLQVGVAAYPFIGGALALFGWYFPFLLPVLGIPVGFLVLFFLNNPEPKNTQDLPDYLKSAFKSIMRPQVLGIFFAGIVTFIVIVGAYMTYFPILLVDSFEASSLEIGILMSCMALSTGISSSQLGRVSKIYPERKLIKFSYFLGFISLLLITFVNSLWLILLVIFLMGLALGISIPAVMSVLAELSPDESRGVFMSLNGSIIRIGQTIGPLMMGFIFGLYGLNATFLAAAILFLITGFVLLLIFK